MVAATAVYFDVPVISRDRRIRAASLKTIWRWGRGRILMMHVVFNLYSFNSNNSYEANPTSQ
jgi:hypothetical protein